MNKKAIAVVGVALIVAVAAFLLFGTGGEASVTSNQDNTITMTAKDGASAKLATGSIVVRQGQRVRMDYALEKGSFDVIFDVPGHDFYSIKDLQGSGSEDFVGEEGEYQVYFTLHKATGEAKIFID